MTSLGEIDSRRLGQGSAIRTQRVRRCDRESIPSITRIALRGSTLGPPFGLDPTYATNVCDVEAMTSHREIDTAVGWVKDRRSGPNVSDDATAYPSRPSRGSRCVGSTLGPPFGLDPTYATTWVCAMSLGDIVRSKRHSRRLGQGSAIRTQRVRGATANPPLPARGLRWVRPSALTQPTYLHNTQQQVPNQFDGGQ